MDEVADQVDNPSVAMPDGIARALGQLHARLGRGILPDQVETAVRKVLRHQTAITGKRVRVKREGKINQSGLFVVLSSRSRKT